MKGLILSAGRGSRLYPLSHSTPKSLLPVSNKPILQYGIESLVKCGIKEIGIVINPTDQEKYALFFKQLSIDDISISYIYQHSPKGLADAVKQAQEFIQDEPFLLVLGDNIIYEPLQPLVDHIIHDHKNGSILLTEVPNPEDFGIATLNGNVISHIEEKPKSPTSNLAVIGAYAFDSSIFQAIQSIQPSHRGEYEITDAIHWLIQNQFQIAYSITDQYFSDVGTFDRWLKSNQRELEQIPLTPFPQTLISKQVKIIPPVVIGKNCVIENATIGPNVSIGDHVTIRNCKVNDSIILANSTLQDIRSVIAQSIIGENTKIIHTTSDPHITRFIVSQDTQINY
ncbi:NTP transferase domain-containing protein [Hazenella sp. IB182357]|uniref:NTP transferase domain-containing protein n=1 Tax=Polycladospora coralii TaxID=2771432 RepID=A0A926N7U9_9BACL|nr:sugar phosphate nucleotidyltransferase [Polycladospora coralii]MBD1371153.1 NTP transferase domain-containing protein [Polycladospora coralii]MBS7530095.1 NTP transferase domain-containing protein [Polycladospora coralii]